MKLALVTCLAIAVPTLAAADPWTLDLEASPLYPAFKGAGLGASLNAPAHWHVGAYAVTLELPSFARGDNDPGWESRHVGLALTAQYNVGADQRGLYLGVIVAPHRNFYSLGGETVAITEVRAGPQIGYRWFPFRGVDAFVHPTLQVGIHVYRSKDPMLGGATYELTRVVPIPSLFLGWRL